MQADGGVIIPKDIEHLTLAAGLDAMRELDLVSFEGKWNIYTTGANANIKNNACTTYIGLILASRA